MRQLSSSSGTKTTATSGAPGSTTTTAAPAPNKAADEQVARSAQLRLTDFPTGWEESDKTSATSKSNCQVVEGAKAAVSARESSRTFSKSGDQAQSTVYVYADTATAGHWFAELTSSATRSCLGDQLGKQVASNTKGEGVKVGEITTASLSIEPVGDERAAARLTIPVSQESISIKARADLIFVRVDRGIAILILLGTVTPFDETLAAKLTREVTDRLGTGLKPTATE